MIFCVSRGAMLLRGFLVHAREQAMQVFRPVQFGTLTHTFTQLFGPLGRLCQAFEQRAKVKPGSGGDDRQLPAPVHVFEHIEGSPAIFTGRENFVRLDEINEMMRDATLFGGRHFARANIEVTINLSGIADEDFTTEAFGKMLIPSADLPDAVGPRITMSRAPASGATLLIPETPQYRSRSANSTSPASSRAPAICARFVSLVSD